MDKKFQKILHEIKDVRLTPSEKSSVKASIFAKIEEAQTSPIKVQSPYFTWFQISRMRLQLVLASIVLIFLASGGVAFAAQWSLPGDVLYPVKVKVTEKVAGFFHSASALSEARFQTHLMEKRLSEAETLSDSHKLNEPLREQVRENIVLQTNRTKDAVKKADEGEVKNGVVKNSNDTDAPNSDTHTLKANISEEHASEKGDAQMEAVFDKHENILEELKIPSGKSHENQKDSK